MEPDAGPLRRLFLSARRLFLGLSYSLSPVRRLLFVFALGSTAVAAVFGDVQVAFFPRLAAPIGGPLYLLAIALLIFLLALELVDRVRVRDELEVARQLQRELLPAGQPEVPGCTVRHRYRTANEVGGDYYNFLTLSGGEASGEESSGEAGERVAIVIGDASGHGMAAGLLMAIAEATLQLALDLDPSPPKVADLLNRSLFRTGGRRAYMSLFYALLDPRTGEMEYICAGHPYPLLRRRDGTLEELGEGGFPLGLSLRTAPRLARARLEPGDQLVLYTDGLPEALRQDGEAFGFERLKDLVAPGGTPEAMLERILLALDGFVGDEPILDDVSLAVLIRRGTPPALP
jgi:serine phosphatase RsbU (regulator of sigma subunit)